MSNMFLRFLCIALAVIGLGAFAVATDFVWDGAGVGSGDGSEDWTNQSMWVIGSGYPANTNENATLADVSSTPECTFDLTGPTTINDLVLQGVSPTKMTLDLDEGDLTVADFAFGDYGELQADNNFTVVGVTTFSGGDMWIGIVSTKTVDLEDVDTSGSEVHLHATTTGSLKADEVSIDAHADTATRGFRFTGGTWTVENNLLVKGAQTSGTYIGKLWLAAGTINVNNGAAGNAVLEIDGGDAAGRRAELDIDDTLTAEETQFLSGYASIDVASTKTVAGGSVTFKPGAVVTKSGAGTFKSGT